MIEIYCWEGNTRQGIKISGEKEGSSIAFVKAELRKCGIQPRKVKKKSKNIFKIFRKKIKNMDMASFSRQLNTLLDAGLPLFQSLECIEKNCMHPSMKAMISNLKSSIEAGDAFAKACKKHPHCFSSFDISLIEAGEQSGCLVKMLDKLSCTKEKTEIIKGKIRKALFYPVTVLVLGLFITSGIFIFIVPRFEEMFKNFGANLPYATQVVIHLSNALKTYGWVGGILFILIFFVLKKTMHSSHCFLIAWDKFKLRLPFIGDVFKKVAIARFTHTLSLSFSAGMPLVDALHVVAGATGNTLYEENICALREQVKTGQSFYQAVQQLSLFPNDVAQMISVGEESGNLTIMLDKIADLYEKQVDDTVDGLNQLIEPVMMILLGALVGGIVIALYLPLLKMGTIF